MLISISIENFRSIKDKATITFNGSGKHHHLTNNLFECTKSGLSYLKSIGFYGANASGKSNILLAFQALKYLIVMSGNLKDGESIPCYEPFKLNKRCTDLPTRFELSFISTDDIRYTYQIAFNEKRIIEEVLDFYPNKVKSNLFNRQEHDDWNTISFGTKYKGGTKKIPFFANNTYLSKAGNNASAPVIVRDIYNLFWNDLYYIGTTHQFTLNPVVVVGQADHKSGLMLKHLAQVINLVDTGITNVGVKQVEFTLPAEIQALNLPDEVKEKIITDNQKKYVFTHQGDDGSEVEFELSDESEGTKKIFSMMQPIIEAFMHRKVFIFDELDNGLHPHIADFIIKLFNDKSINKVGSQILFSTHNIQLMSPEKMRRDQIYFVEKQAGATTLYSLNDFDKTKVKPTTPYHNWYDDGRFGAIPTINFTKIKSIILDINDPDNAKIDKSIFGDEDA